MFGLKFRFQLRDDIQQDGRDDAIELFDQVVRFLELFHIQVAIGGNLIGA